MAFGLFKSIDVFREILFKLALEVSKLVQVTL